MPRRQRAIPLTRSESDKPVAPGDLWSKLDAVLLASVGCKPEDAFTAVEYGERKGLTAETARKRLDVFASKGILETGKYLGKKWYRVKEGK